MGYCNKRRRSKRRRTRTLNAIQNNRAMHDSLSSSDNSSLGVLGQSSSYTNLCSTFSHHSSHSSSSSPMIPSRILLDNTSKETMDNGEDDNELATVGDDYEEDSVVDNDNTDRILDAREVHLSDMSETNDENHNDDDTIESIGSSSRNINMDNHNPFSEYEHHEFDRVTSHETASFKIMSLLDASGASRICYDRLIALLKKLSKAGFEVKKAVNRDTLMRRLERKCKARPTIEHSVIHNQEVFRFRFQDMLQDLVLSSHQNLHQILPHPVQLENVVTRTKTQHELWHTGWMRDTFDMLPYQNFNQETDVMLPIMLYMDKTGTDVNQRYSLEPVLFSLAAIPREKRESRHSWRHLGFLPQQHTHSEEESTSSLQFYHKCLSYLLEDLKEAQNNPPLIYMKSRNGDMMQRRALLPLMLVMGDQLSQDTLCGRLKSNSGGAGRVHRACMCSYLNIDDPYHKCKKVDLATLQVLTTKARVTEKDIDAKISSHPILASDSKKAGITKTFLQKQRTMFRSILRHPFTTHPILCKCLVGKTSRRFG